MCFGGFKYNIHISYYVQVFLNERLNEGYCNMGQNALLGQMSTTFFWNTKCQARFW